mmetsp:Transcript_17185/g.35453  ORF Transcript_17185/g.35453 Transcript_17185/m.35453 type:complete len:408 (-) Transcript_17185:277-1500(-)
MAPPKPTQKGKFRPKKPQKKASKPISTPATAEAATPSAPPAVNSDDIWRNNAPIEPRGARGGRGGGRGGGGRGRGGRGGRGRGRIPIPQGTVFFTGGEKKSASSAKGSTISKRISSASAGASRTSVKREETNAQVMDASTEEVVGQLDTAIGGTAKAKKESVLEKDDGKDYVEDERPADGGGVSMNLNISAGCMYDSDSSDEASTRAQTNSLIAPLELPFSSKSPMIHPDVTSSSHVDEHDCDVEEAQPVSPFVVTDNMEDIREEKNSWFLVQLPTRLPPMQKAFSSAENDNGDAMETDDQTTTTPAANNALSNISEVAVPPVTTSRFDHGLDKNAPGMIGKILVYKSGKTVLVMDGPDDKVTMNVNEGLTCAFQQQAVAVDVEKGQYVSLGNVDKSIVISPDLTGI